MPILLAGGIGLVLWWLASSSSAKGGGGKTPIPDKRNASPSDWQKAIADAIASGDCDNMRRVAAALESAGMHDAAVDLYARAAKCDNDRKKNARGGGPGPISPDNAARAIASAQALADYISANTKPRGRPVDDPTVHAWQAQEGLKTDGFYGPVTGTRIAAYRVVPPKPWYWPKKGTQKALNDWKALMRQRARENPDNQAAWLAVSKVP
jgi:hypothetical protein